MEPQRAALDVLQNPARATSERCVDPLSALEIDHELQLRLCNLLEHIADGLPGIEDPEVAMVAISVLRTGLEGHTAFEERHLFPLIRYRGSGDPVVEAILTQLEDEHDGDEAFAHELADELERLVSVGTARNPEMLGYMLRGFFVGQRRHIEWENNTILPLARNLLTGEDLMTLRQGLSKLPGPNTSRASLLSIETVGDYS